MVKESMLKNISSIKEEHSYWIKEINNLNFNSIEDKKELINSTLTHFGEWIYTEGSKLRISPSTQHLIDRVEEHNHKLNDLYIDIYKIFFILPTKRNILHKIATLNSKNMSSVEKRLFKKKIEHLNLHSNEILSTMGIIEDRVRSLSDNEIEEIY